MSIFGKLLKVGGGIKLPSSVGSARGADTAAKATGKFRKRLRNGRPARRISWPSAQDLHSQVRAWRSLTQSAIALGKAGPSAQVALIGLSVDMAALMAVTAALGPSLKGAAPGLAALGGAVLDGSRGHVSHGNGGDPAVLCRIRRLWCADPHDGRHRRSDGGGKGSSVHSLRARRPGFWPSAALSSWQRAVCPLMAMAATQMASAGPMALAGLAVVEGGMVALLAVRWHNGSVPCGGVLGSSGLRRCGSNGIRWHVSPWQWQRHRSHLPDLLRWQGLPS